MLDQELQSRLARVGVTAGQGPTIRWLLAGVGLAGLMFVLGFIASTALPSQPIERETLGKLVVITAESSGADPLAVWQSMENFVGKPAQEFSPTDRIKAIGYLVERIELPSERRRNTLISWRDAGEDRN